VIIRIHRVSKEVLGTTMTISTRGEVKRLRGNEIKRERKLEKIRRMFTQLIRNQGRDELVKRLVK